MNETPQHKLDELKNNNTSVGTEAAQNSILALGGRIPILGGFISVSEAIDKTLAERKFSDSVLDILQDCLSNTNGINQEIQTLKNTQKAILAQIVYHTCAAYDDTISMDKKNILSKLLREDLIKAPILNLNLQEIYLSLIQQVPTYSLHFLNQMHNQFGTKVVTQTDEHYNESDKSSPAWINFKSVWLHDNINNDNNLNMEIEMIIEPLILHGLIKETDLGAMSSMQHRYNVTNLGKNFVKYITNEHI